MSGLQAVGSYFDTVRAAKARPDRPRIALMAMLLVAAMPIRLPMEVPVVGSISILDVFLLIVTMTLVLDLPLRRLNWGYPSLAALMAVPTVASLISMAWSVDRLTTLNATIAYLEGFVAYLFVIRELEGLSPDRVIRYIGRYAVLLTIPAVLLLLHVPGFAPHEPGLSESSGDYISYYTRLSHPALGRSNNLAAALFIFVPPLLYWGHTRRRLSASVAGFVALAAVCATFSRGLFVSALVAGLAYLLLLPRTSHAPRRTMVGKLLMVVVGIAATATLFYRLNPPTREFLSGRLDTINVELRLKLYAEALQMILERPLLGYGADAVGSKYASLIVDVHNTYLQQMVNFGLPLGLVVGLAIVALPIPFLLRRRIHPLAGAIGYAVLVEVLSFGFESTFEGMVLRVIFYLSLGLLTGLLSAAEASDTQTAAVEPRSRTLSANKAWRRFP